MNDSRTPGLVGGGAAKRQKMGDVPENEYLVKHFTRSMLLVGDRAGIFGTPASPSQAVEELSVKRLHDWLPDEADCMEPLHHQSAGWLRRTCGVSPFVVSCFTCFAHYLSEQERRAILKATDDELWYAIHEWQRWRVGNREAFDCWPPTFCTLASIDR